MNMKISNSVLGKVVRLGSVAALSATFIVGVSSTASAQGYGQSNDNNRDWRDSHQNNDRDRDWRDSRQSDDNDRSWRDSHRNNDDRDWRDDDGRRWDRNGRFNDRNLGRNRHQYSYNGRAYDYTVDNRRGSEDARDVARRASQNGYE